MTEFWNTQSKNWWKRQKIIISNFATNLSIIDISAEKIIKDIEDLKDTINQLYLIDIYRTIHLDQQNAHLFKCTQNIYQDGAYPGCKKSQQI